MTDFIEHTSISTQTTIEKGENTLLKSRIVSPVLPLVYHGILFLHAFLVFLFQFSSVQLPSCVQLCDPMDCNTTGFPVHPGPCSNSCPLSWWWHPAHPLVSPSPPSLNFSQHQGLLQHHSSKASIFSAQLSLWSNSYIHILLPQKNP